MISYVIIYSAPWSCPAGPASRSSRKARALPLSLSNIFVSLSLSLSIYLSLSKISLSLSLPLSLSDISLSLSLHLSIYLSLSLSKMSLSLSRKGCRRCRRRAASPRARRPGTLNIIVKYSSNLSIYIYLYISLYNITLLYYSHYTTDTI